MGKGGQGNVSGNLNIMCKKKKNPKPQWILELKDINTRRANSLMVNSKIRMQS